METIRQDNTLVFFDLTHEASSVSFGIGIFVHCSIETDCGTMVSLFNKCASRVNPSIP